MEFFMADYIVCHKKRNSPRLNVRICEEKCPSKGVCSDYLAYAKVPVNQEQVPVSPEVSSMALTAP
jgi:hypothetical protein